MIARRVPLAALMVTMGLSGALAQSQQLPPQIITPDSVETRIGPLQFRDGMPSSDTVDKIYNYLDFTRGVESFLGGLPGLSQYAIRKSFRDAGIKDNEDVLIFSELMDSSSLFLTANADTVYFWPWLDLSKGPMVVEIPHDVLGVIDDMWFLWITDVGLPGPDRGLGGKYLVVPPGYQSALPEGGYFVVHSHTNGAGILCRAFLTNNDPKPAVARIKSELKIYPYVPGGYGTSIGAFLEGHASLGPLAKATTPHFVEGSRRVINTIYPNDYSYYEMLNDLVQSEPAEALDPEIAGQFAAIGIVKGKPFKPDGRMQKILAEAVALGNASARSLSFKPRRAEGFDYYDHPRSGWSNSLFVGGYDFTRPPPLVTKDGVKQFPETGARMLNARITMFYVATGITPAMVMRLTNIGSEYLVAQADSNNEPLDGAKTYRVTLSPNIPAAAFWSLTVYDNQSRSMLQTPQRFPRAGSQSYPTAAAVPEPDGSTVVYFGPQRPEHAKEGNWIQTMPNKGWFLMLRLYSPLQPFFDKTWRVGEIEEVK